MATVSVTNSEHEHTEGKLGTGSYTKVFYIRYWNHYPEAIQSVHLFSYNICIWLNFNVCVCVCVCVYERKSSMLSKYSKYFCTPQFFIGLDVR